MSTFCLCEVANDICYKGSTANKLFVSLTRVKLHTICPPKPPIALGNGRECCIRSWTSIQEEIDTIKRTLWQTREMESLLSHTGNGFLVLWLSKASHDDVPSMFSERSKVVLVSSCFVHTIFYLSKAYVVPVHVNKQYRGVCYGNNLF